MRRYFFQKLPFLPSISIARRVSSALRPPSPRAPPATLRTAPGCRPAEREFSAMAGCRRYLGPRVSGGVLRRAVTGESEGSGMPSEGQGAAPRRDAALFEAPGARILALS